uniref:Uncharacterized protein n=1 Tax=viral metagenome TaxID=1070528 RepID=A0A6C0H5B4_9ZZZZ
MNKTIILTLTDTEKEIICFGLILFLMYLICLVILGQSEINWSLLSENPNESELFKEKEKKENKNIFI